MPPRVGRIPGDVELLLAARHGMFTMAEAARAGVTPSRLHRLVRDELLIRLARGVYAGREWYAGLTPWQVFGLRSRAFTVTCGPHAHASGWSAAAIHGLPALGPPPDKPCVVVPTELLGQEGANVDARRHGGRCMEVPDERKPGTGMPRGSRGPWNSRVGRVRVAGVPPEHCTVVGGCRVLTVARTVVDLGRTAPREDALVVADAALATESRPAQLREALRVSDGWPGVAEARWVVEHADGYAETPLETLGRLTFIEHDLPVPVSNAWVELGPVRLRPDHLLEDRWLIFEGDGDGKYANRSAAAVVKHLRERDWQLRQEGFETAHYGWSDARLRRPQLAERFRALIANRDLRPRPVPWWRERRTYRRAA